MIDWISDVTESDKPHYLAIADAIETAIAAGRLAPGDKLPPQRRLAAELKVDFTTAARGYGEAARRGLINSTVGRGTFVLGRTHEAAATLPAQRTSGPDDEFAAGPG